jgi:hypothetical protein
MKTIENQLWLKPMDIAKQGLIMGSKGEAGTVYGHYNYVLELIHAGKLNAVNYSQGARPFYLVSEQEIARYHQSLNKVNRRKRNGSQQN